jgi:tetratricopeptide (TPR) repeat protein
MARALRRPIWRPSKLSGLKSVVSEIVTKISFTRLAIAVFVLPLILYVYREVTRDALIIDPFSVPKRFEEAGLTAEVMANRIGDKLHQIEEITQSRRQKDNLVSFKNEGAINEVEIPGAKLDLKTVIDITRSVFGIYPRHVTGDIVILEGKSADTGQPAAVPQQSTVTIYVSRGRQRSAAVNVTSNADDVALLVKGTAEAVLGQVNPIILASYQQEQGQYEAAVKTVEGVVKNESAVRSQKADAFFLWGLVLQLQGKYGEAIAKYEETLRLDPNFPNAYANWGSSLEAQNRYGDAIAKYRKATEIDPTYAIAYYDWGRALQVQNQNNDAIAKYRKAIEIDPKFAPAYGNWGTILQAQNKFGEAIAKYQKATEIDPSFAEAYSNWGSALLAQNKYDEAVAKCRKASELDPKLQQAFFNWGLALHAQDKYGEAAAEYQKATELDPKFADAYRYWGMALTSQKQFVDAVSKYQKVTELDPKLAVAYNGWGIALENQKMYRAAIAKFQKATELDSTLVDAYNNWGLALKAQGKGDEAALRFKRADELSRARSK